LIDVKRDAATFNKQDPSPIFSRLTLQVGVSFQLSVNCQGDARDFVAICWGVEP